MAHCLGPPPGTENTARQRLIHAQPHTHRCRVVKSQRGLWKAAWDIEAAEVCNLDSQQWIITMKRVKQSGWIRPQTFWIRFQCNWLQTTRFISAWGRQCRHQRALLTFWEGQLLFSLWCQCFVEKHFQIFCQRWTDDDAGNSSLKASSTATTDAWCTHRRWCTSAAGTIATKLALGNIPHNSNRFKPEMCTCAKQRGIRTTVTNRRIVMNVLDLLC